MLDVLGKQDRLSISNTKDVFRIIFELKR